MSENYTLDSLIETFERHAIESGKEEEVMRAEWKECNGEEYPYEKFNLCEALLVMVKEIRSLREQISG